MPISFDLLKTCPHTGARRGRLVTAHATVETPAFMPVGTQGTVKGITAGELDELGAALILGNTYHLYLRPGIEVIARAGGLHRFTGWRGGILTDSGGFQVFSLERLRRVEDNGVSFRSHVDGSTHFLTPERVIRVQNVLGSDIAMVLDQCSPFPCSPENAREAVERTTRWAWRCLQTHQRRGQAVFGIVQGSIYPDLRRRSARDLVSMDFPGYAIGGLSVREPKETMYRMLEATVPELPPGKPRYLMGVGSPDALIEGVRRGIDLFDCVLPTRLARHGRVLTGQGYLAIRNAAYTADMAPLDKACGCPVCRRFNRAYIRHLINAREILGIRLAAYHNLFFLARLMGEIRRAVDEECFTEFYEAQGSQLMKTYGGG